jgi:predicted dehydrogenase
MSEALRLGLVGVVVTIASPNGLHHEHAKRALESGKHVHVNKTVCTTEPTPVTAEHARHVIDIIESGYVAPETGRAQNLTTSFDVPELAEVLH